MFLLWRIVVCLLIKVIVLGEINLNKVIAYPSVNGHLYAIFIGSVAFRHIEKSSYLFVDMYICEEN